MSISIEVRFATVKLPTPVDWQAAIHVEGFDLELDCDFDPKTHTGFLPARYRGDPAGFEYYCDPLNEDATVSLKWGGNLREAASGIIAAACLCKLTSGQLLDPQADEVISALSVMDWARREELGLQEMMTNATTPGNPPNNSSTARAWWKLW